MELEWYKTRHFFFSFFLFFPDPVWTSITTRLPSCAAPEARPGLGARHPFTGTMVPRLCVCELWACVQSSGACSVYVSYIAPLHAVCSQECRNRLKTPISGMVACDEWRCVVLTVLHSTISSVCLWHDDLFFLALNAFVAAIPHITIFFTPLSCFCFSVGPSLQALVCSMQPQECDFQVCLYIHLHLTIQSSGV